MYNVINNFNQSSNIMEHEFKRFPAYLQLLANPPPPPHPPQLDLELIETRTRVYIKKERKNTRLVLYSLSITSLPMAALSLLLES